MIIKSKNIYNGVIIDLDVETVELPNKHVMDMEIVRHPGGSAVVAINSEGEICLLKQYRHVMKDWVWEIPAGKIDDNEDPAVTAIRELKEEAGVSAGDWESLGSFISSPGVFSEVVYLYQATNLVYQGCEQEPGEIMERHWLGLDQAYAWVLDNTIRDGKSIAAITRAYHLNKS